MLTLPCWAVALGLDNDCNGSVDDGDLPDVGVVCQTGLDGVCSEGVSQCLRGEIVCVPNAIFSVETCNGTPCFPYVVSGGVTHTGVCLCVVGFGQAWMTIAMVWWTRTTQAVAIRAPPKTKPQA